MTRVELFEVIRRRRLVEDQGIRRIARELGVHRRTVRQAVEDARPPARKRGEREAPVMTATVRALIEGWLVADRTSPRKQRHTAHRIYTRLCAEHGFAGSEVTVRRYVRQQRRERGVVEVYVVQHYEPGQEAEIDWYEAAVDFPAGREVAQVFAIRACRSGREFHMAFPRQTQQAFLEGHVAAFGYFGGVFVLCRYDNLSAAVKRVLQGRRRIEAERFVALRSHYLFESQFCLPGLVGAHEKGGVEGAGGRFRRAYFVPVPQVADYDALNRYLLDCCARDDQRRIAGRTQTVAEAWAEEVSHLRPVTTPFDTAEMTQARAEDKALVPVRTNRYSVPIRLAGRVLEVRIHARTLEFLQEGRVVARHKRLFGRFGVQIELDHYLELFRFKPGALAGSEALWQARATGRWLDVYDALWRVLRERYGETDGTRQLVEVLLLVRESPADQVTAAVIAALQRGGCDADAIRLLVRGRGDHGADSAGPLDVGDLKRFDRPLGGVGDYDQLLAWTAVPGLQ